MKRMPAAALLAASSFWAQQGDSLIQRLTSRQGAQSRLKSGAGGKAIETELRSLYRKIATGPAALARARAEDVP